MKFSVPYDYPTLWRKAAATPPPQEDTLKVEVIWEAGWEIGFNKGKFYERWWETRPKE